jgi:beta-lactamase class A
MTRPARLASALLALSLPLAARAAGPAPSLEARLAEIAAASGGTLGVRVVHLESGKAAGLNASARFPMASVYKLPIAVVVLAKVDAGELSLAQEVEVRPGEHRRTASRVDPFTPGKKVAIGVLLDDMLTASGNTACDVLLRVLGGPGAVDAWYAAHGLPGIDVSLTELMMGAVESGVADRVKDGECDHACLDGIVAKEPKAKREAAERAFESDPRNSASPEDLGRFLAALKKGELLSPSSTATVLDAMRRCRTGDRRIRALLPKGTVVYDKTGTIGRSANDIGLVELPGGKGTLVVVALVKGSEKPYEERERTIAKVAKAAYDAFAR